MSEDVALLIGGHPSEHRVSLASGVTLLRGLIEAGFRVHPVVIAMDGSWHVTATPASGSEIPWPDAVQTRPAGPWVSGDVLAVATALKSRGVRRVVLGVHGRGGEDGVLQGFLETAGFRFTGSGVLASAVAMDKLLFKRLLVSEGLPTPPFRELLDADDDALRDAVEALGLPLVVKPPALGSSVGVCIVEAARDLPAAVRDARGADGRVLLEAFVRGRELTCPVLGEGRGARALPLIEIVPRKASWFDYKSKYEPEGADEICPAPVHPELRSRTEALALRVHRLIGARGVTRTDFMVDAGGTPLILEINTLPGMTAASLVPKAAAVAGLSIASLVTRLLDDAGESAPAETEAGA